MVCKSSSFIWMLTCTAALFCADFYLGALCQEPWLTTLDLEGLRLRCSVYFGSIQLNDRISTHTPILTSADRDTYGNMVYRFTFPGERYLYPNFDLSQYDVERELGASPYAMFGLEYIKPTTSKSSGEGWCVLCVVVVVGRGVVACIMVCVVVVGRGVVVCIMVCVVVVGRGLLHALWCVCVVVVGRGVAACIMVCLVVVGRGLLCALWCVWWWWAGGLLHALWCVWWWWGGVVVCIMMHVCVVVVGRGVVACIMVRVVVGGGGCVHYDACVCGGGGEGGCYMHYGVCGGGGEGGCCMHYGACVCGGGGEGGCCMHYGAYVWWWWGGGLLHALWCVWLGGGYVVVCTGIYACRLSATEILSDTLKPSPSQVWTSCPWAGPACLCSVAGRRATRLWKPSCCLKGRHGWPCIPGTYPTASSPPSLPHPLRHQKVRCHHDQGERRETA